MRPLDATTLFRDHARFVAGFVRRMGVPREDLDDVLQEVFLVVHRKGGFVPGPAQPKTWLAGIALLEAKTWHRRRSAKPNTAPAADAAEHIHAEGHDPEQEAGTRQRLELVQRALDAMSEDKRAVFMLFELEGESCDSIAAGLGIATGTVYSRLHAARKAFKKAIRRQQTVDAVTGQRAAGGVHAG
jgi:RNA polymerase sigma-70 factor (ECF subfamily)